MGKIKFENQYSPLHCKMHPITDTTILEKYHKPLHGQVHLTRHYIRRGKPSLAITRNCIAFDINIIKYRLMPHGVGSDDFGVV